MGKNSGEEALFQGKNSGQNHRKSFCLITQGCGVICVEGVHYLYTLKDVHGLDRYRLRKSSRGMNDKKSGVV